MPVTPIVNSKNSLASTNVFMPQTTHNPEEKTDNEDTTLAWHREREHQNHQSTLPKIPLVLYA